MKKITLLITVFTFTLGWHVNAQYLTESFEGGVVPPAGWSLTQVNTSETWGLETTTVQDGVNAASIDYDAALGVQDETLTTSVIDLSSATSPELKFWFSMSYYWSVDPNDNYDFTVSATDGTTETVVWTEADQGVFNNFEWYEVTLDLTAYAGQSTVQLLFNYGGSDGAAIYFDNILVRETPTCLPITGLTATNITTTSAELNWTAGNSPAETDWDYALLLGTDPAPTVGTAIAANTYSDTSLVANTDYIFYVRANCGGGDYSTWEQVEFTTLATPPANDACANAEVIVPSTTGAEVWVTGTTLGNTASGEVADTDISCTNAGAFGSGRDVWYTVEVPIAGDITITTQASTGSALTDTIISVWSGTCGAMVGTEVDCDDDGGSGNFSEIVLTGQTAGDILYIRVQEFGAAASRMFGPQDGTFEIAAHAVDPALSTTSFDNELAFSYYPNPVTNTLTLNAQKEITNVAIFNMLGQEVIRTAPNAVSNEVNMSSLQAGAYFVQVTIGQVTETVRIIKN